MKLKEYYLANKNLRYNDIIKVKEENIKLEMNPIRTLKDNWIIVLLIVVAVVGLLLLNFNLTYLIVSLALIAIFVLLFIYGNGTKLSCENGSLHVKQGVQSNIIPYKKLRSVYVARATDWLVLFPVYTYKLIIRYEDNFSFLRELEFPLLCAELDDIIKFVDNFYVNEEILPRYIRYEKSKFWRRFITAVISVIAVIAIFYYLYTSGNINFNI